MCVYNQLYRTLAPCTREKREKKPVIVPNDLRQRILDCLFNFKERPGILDVGDKIEIRWRSDYTANDYHNCATPQAGQYYGTGRLDEAITDPNNNSAWTIPNESEPITFLDPLTSEE